MYLHMKSQIRELSFHQRLRTKIYSTILKEILDMRVSTNCPFLFADYRSRSLIIDVSIGEINPLLTKTEEVTMKNNIRQSNYLQTRSISTKKVIAERRLRNIAISKGNRVVSELLKERDELLNELREVA